MNPRVSQGVHALNSSIICWEKTDVSTVRIAPETTNKAPMSALQSFAMSSVVSQPPRQANARRPCEIVGLVGYALGGLPGERLSNRLGITSTSLEDTKNKMAVIGNVMTVVGPNGQSYGVDSTIREVIETLDAQLANGLGAALGISDAAYALKRVEQQQADKAPAK
jgi:hypothetical protein